MSVMKYHTGPWKVHPGTVWIDSHTKGLMVGPSGIAAVHVLGAFEQPEVGDEATKVAHLVSAAPDLLEAAKELLFRQDTGTSDETWAKCCDALRAAISKAESA